jgi:hypothetical protein
MIRRLTTTALTVAAAALGVLALAGGTAQAAEWTYHDTNANGRADIATRDYTGDGNADDAWLDLDHNGTWELYIHSTGPWFNVVNTERRVNAWKYSSTADWWYVDANYDGRYERLTYDGNRDGVAEYQRVDTDGDGSFDSQWLTIQVAQPVSTTTTAAQQRAANDMMVQHIVTMNQLHFFGDRLFG